VDRERARTRAAQKAAAAYKKQIAELQKALAQSRGEVASMRIAQRPPPPSDQEQILQTLAPVLRSSADGRN
jgi:hypothetical protein